MHVLSQPKISLFQGIHRSTTQIVAPFLSNQKPHNPLIINHYFQNFKKHNEFTLQKYLATHKLMILNNKKNIHIGAQPARNAPI